MADRFTFTGHEPELAYFGYRDLDTGLALVAEHGQSYAIAATEPDRYPVPPEDGRWTAPASAEGKAAKARAKAQADIQGDKAEPPDPPPDPGTGDPGVPDGTENTAGGEI